MRPDLVEHMLANVVLLQALNILVFRDLVVCAFISFLLGLALELFQLGFLNRIFGWDDILYNIVGLIIGVVIAKLVGWNK